MDYINYRTVMVEKCWSKIKSKIKRDKDSKLMPRIAEACKTVTVADRQGWIRHFETYWERCIDKELDLK